jgi:hypothetical protein
MSATSCIIIGIVVFVLAGVVDQTPTTSRTLQPVASGFATVDLFVDSGNQPLAAWQIEFKAIAGQVEIVGIERGDNKDFQDPPYYDPAALQTNRIIVGAFNITDRLPIGKTRVAKLHLHISGGVKPVYAAKLIVAGDKEGKPITAQASLGQSEGEEK